MKTIMSLASTQQRKMLIDVAELNSPKQSLTIQTEYFQRELETHNEYIATLESRFVDEMISVLNIIAGEFAIRCHSITPRS